MKKKPSPRLKYFNYKGSYAYFITICTFKRKNYFKNKETINLVLNILISTTKNHNYEIFAYCFMPDHLHFLIQGEETSNLKKFMREFKQKTEFYYKQLYNDNLWHLSYYDHIVRKEENLKEITLYIFNNPVRKGIVNNFKEYNYSGSLIFNVKEM